MALGLGGALALGAGLDLAGGLLGQQQASRQRGLASQQLGKLRRSPAGQGMQQAMLDLRGMSQDMPVRARRQLEGRLANRQQLERQRIMEGLARGGVSQASEIGQRSLRGSTIGLEGARQQGLMGIEQLRAGLLRGEIGAGGQVARSLYPSASSLFQQGMPQTYVDPFSTGKQLLFANLLRGDGGGGTPPGVRDPRY